MNVSISKPDSLGTIAGILCLLHCLATPLLFVALASSTSVGDEAPAWWVSMNYIFLFISLIAVYRSAQTTSRSYMKPLFWISWVILAVVLINEQIGWIELAEVYSYIAASFLVILHLYNRRYCHCKADHCCADSTKKSFDS
ncbi:MAG: MerC domain-containing protein [Balneola sp.]